MKTHCLTFALLMLCFIVQAQKPVPMFNNTYEKRWKKVDSLQAKSLPQSAKKEVEAIFEMAKKEQNADQTVKAFVHLMKFSSWREEEALVKNLLFAEKETEMAAEPARSLMHSMLAEIYWNYYQTNRHRFVNRTQTDVVLDSDIRTWDLFKVVNKVTEHHLKALEKKDLLLGLKTEVFKESINKGYSSALLRPTLYEFVAHRAIDFFSAEEPSLTKTADYFDITQLKFLTNTQEFAETYLETQDTLSFKFLALKLLQNLLYIRPKDANPNALLDLEIKRLRWLKGLGNSSTHDERYVAALRWLENEYASHEASAMASYFIAFYDHELAAKYKPFGNVENQWKYKEAIERCEQIVKKFPKSDGAKNAISLKASILQKNLHAETERVNMPQLPWKVFCSYKNLEFLHLRIYATSESDFEAIDKLVEKSRKKNEYKSHNEVLIDYFSPKKPQKAWSSKLPNVGDFQSHSVELPMPALPLGNYVVLISDDSSFTYEKHAVTLVETQVSDLMVLDRNLKDNTKEIYVLSRTTGVGLAKAKINLRSEYYDYQKYTYVKKNIGTFFTDEKGKFSYQAKENGETLVFEITYGEDKLIEDKRGYRVNSLYVNKQNPETDKASKSTYYKIFTDRAIYRPGQLVYFKCLVYESDGTESRVLPKRKEIFTLHDVNGKEINKMELTTNEFGTCNGVFTLPTSGLTGIFTLRSNYYSQIGFRVEEYKRPKFEVGFEPLKGSFKLGEELTVTGKAKAYSGASIDGATVKYRVVRKARFPVWWFWRRGYYPESPEVEVKNGVVITDETGLFNIKFVALNDPTVSKESSPVFTFTVYADVTDQNGETRSSSIGVSVGHVAMELNLNIPETVFNHSVEPFEVKSKNLNGEPEPSKVKIKIFPLKSPQKAFRKRLWETPDFHVLGKEEHDKIFPFDEFLKEGDKSTWAKEKAVFEIELDTKTSTSFSPKDLKKWSLGSYLVEAESKDAFGNAVFASHVFVLNDLKSQKLTDFEPLSLIALTPSLEPEQTAQYRMSVGFEQVNLWIGLEKDGEKMSENWLALKKENRVFSQQVTEKDRGGFSVVVFYVLQNRFYQEVLFLNVPHSHKELDIEFSTFRDKLQPGEKEEWQIKIKGKKGDKVLAEMAATLYDASLDAFAKQQWWLSVYKMSGTYSRWQNSISPIDRQPFYLVTKYWNSLPSGAYRSFDELNWFGYYHNYGRGYYDDYGDEEMLMDIEDRNIVRKSAPRSKMASVGMAKKESMSMGAPAMERSLGEEAEEMVENISKSEETEKEVQIRTNFNETAFFFPDLKTDESGNLLVKFQIPEALTRWKLLSFAHTQDMKFGMAEKSLVTQKELMVVPNPPRFFREGDKISFSCKITNMNQAIANGKVKLQLFDALSMKDISTELLSEANSQSQDFTIGGGLSLAKSWKLKIPVGYGAITYRVVAQAGAFSDGEEMAIPVLTNRMMVTETLPMWVRSKQTKTFKLEKLMTHQSSTLVNHSLTLECTSQPAWYALQALPYLMEYPYECAEQTFSKFYANSIANHIVNSDPKVKRVFDAWKTKSPDALLSNLEKNQELKMLLLEETPWVREAKNESEAKRRIAIYFELNRIADELDKAKDKLSKMQLSNGAWPWFHKMPADRYITQHIVAGFGKLDKLGIESLRKDEKTWGMLKKAVAYCDQELERDYKELLRSVALKYTTLKDFNLWHTHLHYFYMRSFFKDLPIPKSTQTAFDYYLGQSQKHWTKFGRHNQGMIALFLERYQPKSIAIKDILKSLREHAIVSEEFGMYWKENYGYYWHQAPIENHALMIEVFQEVAKDPIAVDNLKVWLLKEKQTSSWKTTKATAEACYALLKQGGDWLKSDKLVEVTLGKQKIEPEKETSVEAGTGYFKIRFNAETIKKEMGEVTLSKTDDGLSWGALYWQYFEDLDKITPAETPLKLQKELFLQENSPTGPKLVALDKQKLKVGDLLKVRIVLRVDRNMEYVHLKDMRASAFEPTNVLSSYKQQDGLHYYESTRDASTNFFISYLPKGTYVFEYPLRVSQSGEFSNGITSIQCMYAPEFSSHSQGIRVVVE